MRDICLSDRCPSPYMVEFTTPIQWRICTICQAKCHVCETCAGTVMKYRTIEANECQEKKGWGLFRILGNAVWSAFTKCSARREIAADKC